MLIEAVRIPSATLEGAVPMSTQIEKLLKTIPEVRTVYCKTGRPEIANDVMGVHQTDVWTMLKPAGRMAAGHDPRRADRGDGQAAHRERPGRQVRLQPADRDAGQRAGRRGQERRGRADLRRRPGSPAPTRARRSSACCARIPGATDVKADYRANAADAHASRPPRPARAIRDQGPTCSTPSPRSAGTTVGTDLRRARLAFRSWSASRDPGEKTRATGAARSGRRVQGRPIVRSGDLADVNFEERPAEIEHEASQRRTVVRCNVRGRDIAGFVAEAQAAIDAQVKLPPGYLVRWGGQFEHLQTATLRLAIVVPIVLLLIFLLLYSTFQLDAAGAADLPGRADGGDRRRLRPGAPRHAVLDLGRRRLHRALRRGRAQRPGLGQRRRAPAAGGRRAARGRPRGGRSSGSGRS